MVGLRLLSDEVRPPITRLAAQRQFDRQIGHSTEEIAMRNANQALNRLLASIVLSYCCQPGVPFRKCRLNKTPNRRESLDMRLVILLLTTLAILFPLYSTASADLVRIEKTFGPSNFGVRLLDRRAFVYSDRDYVFADFPNCLQNWTYLVTPNREKFSKGSELVALRAEQPVFVYIGYDSRYPKQTQPDWLKRDYDKTLLSMSVVDPRNNQPVLTFHMFRSRAPLSEIKLGGNISSQEKSNFGMYTAVFVSRDKDSCM